MTDIEHRRSWKCGVCGNMTPIIPGVDYVPKRLLDKERRINAELRARLDGGDPGAVERYREALRWIATYGTNEGDLLTGHEDAMRNIARSTLGDG